MTKNMIAGFVIAASFFNVAGIAVTQAAPGITLRVDADSANAVGTWKPTVSFPNSRGEMGRSFYSARKGDSVKYPVELEPGWYDLYFWNLVYQNHQNPMKMRATVCANSRVVKNIDLPVNITSADREGRWDKIGTYYFAGGKDEYVLLVATGGACARTADIKLVGNPKYQPPPTLTSGTTVVDDYAGSNIEAVAGCFRVYVKGESGSAAQLELLRNGGVVGGVFVDFDGGWQLFGNYRFEDLDTLSFMTYALKGATGLRSVKFESASADKLIVGHIKLQNDSLAKSCNYMQAGYHTVTADITPGNSRTAVMVLELYEDGELQESAAAQKTELSGEKVSVTAGIPITSVSENTVLQVKVGESAAELSSLPVVKLYYTERQEKSPPFLITAASFDDTGSWSHYSDKDSVSGSSILMGRTEKGAVRDAKVQLNVRAGGTYHLWVRSRNFSSEPSARFFKVKVNGEPTNKTFGQVGKDGFFWEDGGAITLKQGLNEVALVDSSCHYARFDAIYITESAATPSDSYAELAANGALVSKYVSKMPLSAMMTGFKISKDFSGGNVRVLSKHNDIVTIAPDLTDTRGATWFYWNFKAVSDIDRTVTFKFDHPGSVVFNATGVVYSRDNGLNWDYLTDYKYPQREFKYAFKAGQELWFSATLPYVQKDLLDYIATIKEHPVVKIATLCKSETGRDVPLIILGNPSAPKKIVFTSRHHCCEATASYLLEGAISYLLDEADKSLFSEYCVYIIPMMDIDGVENGDQGKKRYPHDYNEDYVAELYPSIRALKALVADMAVEIFIDFHCPMLHGPKPYFYIRDTEQEIEKFATQLKAATRDDEIFYDGSNDVRLDVRINKSVGWFSSAKNPRLATTLEVPYAGKDIKYLPPNVRAFGRKTMIALIAYLEH